MDYSPRDEREIKNDFATYDQIDERQSIELLVLLEKWEKGQMQPWDVLLDMCNTVGARGSYLISLEVGRNYAPGTPNAEDEITRTRKHITDEYNQIDFMTLFNLNKLKTRIRELKEGRTDGPPQRNMFGSLIDPQDGSKRPLTPITKVIENLKEELDALIAKHPELGNAPKINDDLQGSRNYVDTLQDMIRIRDAAVVEPNIAFQLQADLAIAQTRLMKKERETAYTNIESEIETVKRNQQIKWDETIQHVKDYMRRETLDPVRHQKVIIPNIQAIREKLESAEFDSWAGALAMAQVLYKPHSKDDRSAPIAEFEQDLKREREKLEALKPDVKKTLDAFKPTAEDYIKAPLALEWAKGRAFTVWHEEKLKTYPLEYAARHGKEPDKYALEWGTNYSSFNLEGMPGVPENPADIPFQPPIDYPDRKLCQEIYVTPSGTGLIEVYERGAYDEAHERDIYGTTVARITTYSVTFVPRLPGDLEDLKKTLSRALEVLGDTPHKYERPGYTPSGESYKRVSGTPHENHGRGYHEWDVTSSNFIEEQNGNLIPHAYFDLDDLWLLYFLMEPVIEPGAQIAAAMNGARYAEERGAILTPRSFDYVHEGHEVGDDQTLLKTREPDLLASAIRDVMIDRALDKIDDAEWTVRMATMAVHTLSGRVTDMHGSFPAFEALIVDQRAQGRAVISYDVALRERTTDLMRCAVGLSKDSRMPIASALGAISARLAGPLKEKFRAEAKHKRKDFYARLDEEMDYGFGSRKHARRSHGDPFADMVEEFDERDFATRLSDIFAGHAGRTDEQIKQAKEKALSRPTSLVIAASKVEPAIDGVHAGGRYTTRTAGAPWTRFDLPKSLQPFAPQGQHSPLRNLLADLKSLKL